jgi:hypothetical protein
VRIRSAPILFHKLFSQTFFLAAALGEATPKMAGGARLHCDDAWRLLIQKLLQSNP